MIIDEAFDRFLDLLRPKAIAIPPMDGTMRPNAALDAAPVLLHMPEPDNAANVAGDFWFSSGSSIYRVDLSGGVMEPEEVRTFACEVACLAGSADGAYAVGLDDGTIVLAGPDGARDMPGLGPDALTCPTAMCFLEPRTLVVCQGSRLVPPSQGTRDLMNAGASGSVWLLDLDSNTAECLAAGLRYPYGVSAQAGAGAGLLVSESWSHRLVRVRPGGRSPETVLDDLHGYPARLAGMSDGRVLMAMFAPRNRLVEFVLMEDGFRREMVDTVDPEHWIAPALRSGASFLEPLQQGGVKVMGIHKPWAPSLSYGLVVLLDGEGVPAASFHSRANGKRHGMTSCCEVHNRLFATSKGGHCILELSVSG